MSNTDENKKYIQDLFDSDGIKAPESLSEDNMMKLLESDKVISEASSSDSKKEASAGTPGPGFKEVRPKRSLKKAMGIAAALLVAVVGISGIHKALTAPPETAPVKGELYTFRDEKEIQNLVDSMSRMTPDMYIQDDTSSRTDVVEDYGVLESSESAAPKTQDNSTSGSATSPSHSETYLQVEDVDEADIVKTDGNYIYYVNSAKEVVILSAKDGKTEKVGSVGAGSIDNYVQDIYIKGDTMVTVGRFYTGDDEGSSGLAIYDISDRSKPELISYFRQSGEVVTSRMVGDFIYLVTEDYVYNGGRYLPKCGLDDSYDSLAPTDISCLPSPRSCSYIVLGAVDVSSGKQLRSAAKAVFGATEDIYCNDHNLYSVSYEWSNDTGEEETRIARASLDGLRVRFSGTASVPGHIVNRYAMDESDGHFRIATTSYRDGIDVNNLYVLDKDLEAVGMVKGFARNESIKAVRYIGSKAYVITYEAIDPLFIIDLADPEDPRIEGEVKIDGFSTLLIPAGDGKLLGIGHATGDNGYGGEYDSGLKIVLFDISDPSHPKVLASKEFENMTSPAQDDSRALTVNNEAGWYAVPYGIDKYNGAELLTDDETGAPDPAAAYEAGVLVFRTDDGFGSTYPAALGSMYLARSVYIGDYIYALDSDGNCSSFRPEI